LTRFERHVPPVALLLGVTGVLVVGALDFATGFLLRVDSLYFPPVGLVAWRLGRRAGFALAAVAAATSCGARWLTGLEAGEAFVLAWNTFALLAGCLLVALLAAAQRERLERDRTLSRVDSLTGLPNSEAFRERATLEAERSRRWRRPVSLSFMSLQDYGALVHEFGPAVGDEVLRTAAVSLRSSIRSTDLAARVAGGEFALLLPETNRNGAATVLERVRDRLGQDMRRCGWPVTASFGPVTSAEATAGDGTDHDADRLMRELSRGLRDPAAGGPETPSVSPT
jgi:diguanylate cyclase (GGDEF)-like protein